MTAEIGRCDRGLAVRAEDLAFADIALEDTVVIARAAAAVARRACGVRLAEVAGPHDGAGREHERQEADSAPHHEHSLTSGWRRLLTRGHKGSAPAAAEGKRRRGSHDQEGRSAPSDAPASLMGSLRDAGDDARADGAAALAHREAHARLHRDGLV